MTEYTYLFVIGGIIYAAAVFWLVYYIGKGFK